MCKHNLSDLISGRAGIVSLTCAATLLMVAASSAEAGRYGHRGARTYYNNGVVVTARSLYGNGSYSAPIRRGRGRHQGVWQVRLPHNTWIDCIRSCEETLRVNTVDLYENQGVMAGYGTFLNQCGVLGCLQITVPLDD